MFDSKEVVVTGNLINLVDIMFRIHYSTGSFYPPMFAEKNYRDSNSFIMRLIKNGPIIHLIVLNIPTSDVGMNASISEVIVR